ncbi:MarR family transcriptional regulator [Amycolatopsis sp. NPDC059657]|uniref:MarR family transcriptional regulator n=1 Tax=Amycolatopsis sp. NPDC059657 TaxID=3346899 RepID=UPI003670CB9C
MSSKTRTRTTRTTATTTGTARALRSVPEPTAAKTRTEAEDKLWEALHATPNKTAADLSGTAKIGKSTAQKILGKWAADGSVTRTAGIVEGGRRAADLWAIAEVDTGNADPAPKANPAGSDADTTVTPAEPEAEVCAATDGADLAEAAPPVSEGSDLAAASVTPDDDGSAATKEDPAEHTGTTADDQQNPADADETRPTDAEPAVAVGSVPAVANGAGDATTEGDTTTQDGTDKTSERKERLAPGGLRGMVEDYLRDHPGDQFGPTAIANALGGKSSGAVSNALDKLVEGGVAVKTQDKPRRFALTPSEQQAPAPAK